MLAPVVAPDGYTSDQLYLTRNNSFMQATLYKFMALYLQ